MATVIIRHRVEDYPRWKEAFDGFVETRRAGGEESYRVTHVSGEENNLLLVFDWDSATNARRFMESPDLVAVMKGAGVIEPPDVWIAEDLAAGNT